MHKKAQEVLGFFVFFAVLVAIAVFVSYRVFYGPAPEFIGSKQLDLLAKAKEADKAQIYLEQSVKIVTPNSFKLLAGKESGCGSYLGFPIWSNRTIKCEPTKAYLRSKYEELFNQNIGGFLSKYRAVVFPQENFNLAFKEGNKLKIIGKAIKSLVIPFAGAATYNSEQIDTFFKSNKAHPNSPLEGLGPCLVQAELRTGIPSIVLMGITILESGWGESRLAGPSCLSGGPSYNLFSIKGSQRSPGTAGICEWQTNECLTQQEEKDFGKRVIQCNPNPAPETCVIGKSDCVVRDDFRAYASKCDSVNDVVRLLQTPNYWEGKGGQPDCKPVKEMLSDPVEVVRRIGGCGYATGAGWADNIIKVMDTITRNAGRGESAGSGGVYIVNPNFKTEINYSLNEYEVIKSNLTKISADITNICLSRDNQDECINEVLAKEKDFKWSLGCGSEEEKVFIDLVETFILCSESAEEGVCLFNVPDKTTSFSFKWDKVGDKIIATSKPLNLTIEQDRPLITDTFSPEKRPILVTCDEINLNIENQRAVLEAKNCAGKGNLEYRYDKQIPLVKTISTATKKSFVMFPDPNVYTKVKNDLKQIKLSKQEIRLCAESKYSFMNRTGKEENYIYKIAFFVGDIVPPNPVKEINIKDTKPAEKNITVEFISNEEQDIDHYNVYYSAESFNKVDQKEPKIQLLGSIIHDGSETYSRTFKVPEDNVPYYLAVVAVDKSGNVNYNVESKSGMSEDDINPGPIEGINVERTGSIKPEVNIVINKPLKNVDNTDIDDLSQYVIFIKKVDSDSCLGTTPKQVVDNNKFYPYSFEVTEQGQHAIMNKDLSLIDPLAKTGSKYCVVAIAQDEVPETSIDSSRYSDKGIAFISFP